MQGNSKEETKWAYIAGLIDGEGSIMIMRQAHESFMKQRAASGCFDPHYHPQIRIGMIDRRPIDFICEVSGIGKVIEEKPYHHKRPMFRWNIRRRDEITAFLQKIMPYLLVKTEQAKLALNFCENWIGKPGLRLTDENRKKREAAWLAMRSLNGVVSPATTERKGKRGRDFSIRLEATV